jgi:multisubunit Na+/H+ antiporter MnhG subunit
MRDVILGAAIGALIEFVAIAGFLRLAERVMPRLNPRTAEILAGVLVVTVLGCICFLGLPQLLSVEARLGAILLNLAFALWAMLVLHFALQSQSNKRKVDEVSRSLEEEVSRRLEEIEGKLKNNASFQSTVLDELVKILGKPRFDVNKAGKIVGAPQPRYSNIEDISEVIVEMRQDLRGAQVILTPSIGEED